MSSTTDNRVILGRGNLTGTGGAAAAPGSGATVTILDTTTGNSFAAMVDRIPFARVQFNLLSSHDSGASGIVFSSSFDRGANFDTQQTYTYVASGGAKSYDYEVLGGHLKIAYTNSASVLTSWRWEVVGIYDRSSGL